jgi:hypothetical protein
MNPKDAKGAEDTKAGDHQGRPPLSRGFAPFVFHTLS